MADEKIKISWEEINSPEVDVRIKQEGVLARAQEHYHQQASPLLPDIATSPHTKPSIWYNTVFYMAVFGAIAGIVGWSVGEIVYSLIPNRLEEFGEFGLQLDDITTQQSQGEISAAEAEARTTQLILAYEDNPYVKEFQEVRLSDAEKQVRIEKMVEADQAKLVIAVLVFLSLVGIAVAFFLSIADQVVGRNWRGVLINGSVAVALGLLGGVVGGIITGFLYQALGGGQNSISGTQILARAIGWATFGLFLAIAPGLVLRSWKRFGIGLLGGFVGGFLGGLLFDPISLATNSAVVSRFVGILGIGVFAGVGTSLLETVAKTGWLRVVAGLIAGKQFIIYKNPTYIGSSPQCEIYLFKDPQVGPQHAAIHTVPGGYEIQDLGSPCGTFVNGHAVARTRLNPNDHIQIGATTLMFQEKSRPGG